MTCSASALKIAVQTLCSLISDLLVQIEVSSFEQMLTETPVNAHVFVIEIETIEGCMDLFHCACVDTISEVQNAVLSAVEGRTFVSSLRNTGKLRK